MSVRLAWRAGLAMLLSLLAPAVSAAHVGSPDVVFEGKAGAYEVRVIVRVPQVVPGLADVTVRVLNGEATVVHIQPVFWRVGIKGSPSPDLAMPVRGASGLFSGQLWLMARGSYSVYVTVAGPTGTGMASVPVMSVATGRLGMSFGLGALLVALGALLLAGLITIAYVAAGESVVEPGHEIGPSRRKRARIIGAIAAPVLALITLGGAKWWQSVDERYQSRMYRLPPARANITRDAGRPVLRFTVVDSAGAPMALDPLVPDHGKLMHLFVIESASMMTFAHLHPVISGTNQFVTPLPPLPTGPYRLYADVTTETGQSHTLTAFLRLTRADSIQARSSALEDPDDSWRTAPAAQRYDPSAVTDTLEDGSTLEWLADSARLRVGEDATLRFRVRDPSGSVATLDPYLGMSAHAVIAAKDGSVFVHLHPAGTISMAAQQVFVLRDRGDTTPAGRLRLADTTTAHPMSMAGEFSVPYVFPRPGTYRLWVQVKRAGRVLTGVFDVAV